MDCRGKVHPTPLLPDKTRKILSEQNRYLKPANSGPPDSQQLPVPWNTRRMWAHAPAHRAAAPAGRADPRTGLGRDIARSGRSATPSTRSMRRTKCRKSRSVTGRRPALACTLAHAAVSKETVCSSALIAITPACSTRRINRIISPLSIPAHRSPSSSAVSITRRAISLRFNGNSLIISFAVFIVFSVGGSAFLMLVKQKNLFYMLKCRKIHNTM